MRDQYKKTAAEVAKMIGCSVSTVEKLRLIRHYPDLGEEIEHNEMSINKAWTIARERKNGQVRQQLNHLLDPEAIEYAKQMAENLNVKPGQLVDCAIFYMAQRMTESDSGLYDVVHFVDWLIPPAPRPIIRKAIKLK